MSPAGLDGRCPVPHRVLYVDRTCDWRRWRSRDDLRAVGALGSPPNLGGSWPITALILTEVGELTSESDSTASGDDARLYGAACVKVVDMTNATLEVANMAMGARNMAAKRPQHEISVQSFIDAAERHERDFPPRYKAFIEACTVAREVAERFRAGAVTGDPELVLLIAVDDETYGQTSVAAHILRTTFGPTPSAFLGGLETLNAAIQADIFSYGEDGFVGHVYSPPVVAAAEERACPWCAETIKTAAIVCRFCGRDIQPHATMR
jgi:hypothetical protein